MDNELESLENELRALRPRGLTPTLVSRIHAQLRPDRSIWFSWAPVPALLALGVGALFAVKAPSAGQDFKPVSSNSQLVAANEHLVTLSDGTLAVVTKSSSIDTITWKDASGRGSLTWSGTREEATVTPLTYE